MVLCDFMNNNKSARNSTKKKRFQLQNEEKFMDYFR